MRTTETLTLKKDLAILRVTKIVEGVSIQFEEPQNHRPLRALVHGLRYRYINTIVGDVGQQDSLSGCNHHE